MRLDPTKMESVFGAQQEMSPGEQWWALMEADRNRRLDQWYERPEWERTAFMGDVGPLGMRPEELESIAERMLPGRSERETEILDTAWRARPDIEKQRIIRRARAHAPTDELERLAMSLASR
jgi:hypothetical protein